MNILLDTHYLLWTLNGNIHSKKILNLLQDPENNIYYSLISIWEIGIKHHRHPKEMPCTAKEIDQYAKEAGFQIIKLREEHIYALDEIRIKEGNKEHKDPFDRLLIAQSIYENMKFVTADGEMKVYDEPNILMIEP